MADYRETTEKTNDPNEDLPAAIRHIKVGRLQEMAVRDVWPMEERHLTPWLAANLDVLEAELGIRLELVEREHRVGRYELDLLLRSVDDSRVVIVENQFGSSDHNHLGQLLAYAAGTDADIVVWLAEAFTDEHLAALEWMNAAMSEGAGFFAITLKAVKIGDSLPAPIMETQLKPNEWLKQTVRQRQAAQRETQDWDWGQYAAQLHTPGDRIETAQRLVDALDEELRRRGRDCRIQFRKGYVALQRPGGYNVVLVDIYWNRPLRIAAKIPAAPDELGLRSPFPELMAHYDAGQHEWGFGPVPAGVRLDVGRLLDRILEFHPPAGPMVVPSRD